MRIAQTTPKNVRMYIVVFCIIQYVAWGHIFLRKMEPLTDMKVTYAEQAAKQLGVRWHPMKWKQTLGLRWTVSRNVWFSRKYTTICTPNSGGATQLIVPNPSPKLL